MGADGHLAVPQALQEGVEGSGERASGTVKSDGFFTAVMPSPKGDVHFTGKVTARNVAGTWKGPDCWGSVDLNR